MNLVSIKEQLKSTGKSYYPSYIRSVVAMNSTGRHQFGIVAGQNPSFTSYNIERRLDQNNAFVATHLGFFLVYAASAAAVATAARNTYPNPATLIPGDTTPTVAEVAAAEALYTGYLSITTDQNNIIPALDMERFRVAPGTQQYVGNAVTLGALRLNYNPADAQTAGDGFISMFPSVFTIDGARQQNWTVNSVAQTALSDVYLVFEARGYEVTQGAGMSLID